MAVSNTLFSNEKGFSRGQMQIPAGEILQIAELSLMRGAEVAPHYQFCDEITYVVSGKATIYSGDTVTEMSAGQIHYMKQGPTHRIVADPEQNFRYYCIGFTLNQQYDAIQLFLNTIKDKTDFFIEDEGNIKTLFGLLMNEFYIRDEESDLMIHFYFCQMLIILHRILSGRSKEKLSTINTSSSNHAVYRTLKYIDKHYLKLTNVKQIAADLSYSEYYLSHIFKEKMDVTMKDYLMQKKIMTATELLETSNMTISEIAEQLHFSSLHSFGTAFKRYMNMSATEYRKRK